MAQHIHAKTMAHPHLKGLGKHPHPATKTKESTTYHPRLAKRQPVTHNTDPKEEGTREGEQAEENGLGWRNQISGSGLRRYMGRRPPHGRAHRTSRLESVL